MNNKTTEVKPNNIVAMCVISESELAEVIPNYSREFEEAPGFSKILYNLGMDTDYKVETQDGLWHRNRLNKVVLCRRFVGSERTDKDWITSGYASVEAKDKASGSRLLEDVYRARGMTSDAQIRLEARDVYNVVDESVQE